MITLLRVGSLDVQFILNIVIITYKTTIMFSSSSMFNLWIKMTMKYCLIISSTPVKLQYYSHFELFRYDLSQKLGTCLLVVFLQLITFHYLIRRLSYFQTVTIFSIKRLDENQLLVSHQASTTETILTLKAEMNLAFNRKILKLSKLKSCL